MAGGCHQTATNTASTFSIDTSGKASRSLTCINPASRSALMAQKSNNGGSQPVAGQSPAQAGVLDTAHWPAKPWPPHMVWIPAGHFIMGGVGSEARKDEYPVHPVKITGFWMDKTELTIGAFKRFVRATGFITEAEKTPQWSQLKQQLPPGTPEPEPGTLLAGGLVFTKTDGAVPLDNIARWWQYVPGANWRHPNGPASDVWSTSQFDNHPVTQVCWYDAVAYCKWAHKRLPSEAEWEYACRGGLSAKEFAWGDDAPSATNIKANLWEGDFPYKNLLHDGYELSAPVMSYSPNGYGLYDMIGNVWEWCSDWYRPDTYSQVLPNATDPAGPSKAYDPDEPYAQKKVIRGGSFLCNIHYCASYRPSARMKTDPYSGENHTGFRPVMSEEEWRKSNHLLASK
ncbi:Formylglycine-generating enzyme, required for sulfatase activity, contains SUMF1/FGE domain [Chitinophaga costaii]|uniref:Formylglycine-generating enzyme, required for sulfatase activity, contains SUMF1/FGE domain n=2 Tax=Chitinophaga costaii TaxID=1335309 RepID=A0A1C4CBH9_9BACT|nr:Formylglycine-generating enzyme, required for sulfatase activity, contains SUMF1/FGE domain [Chitinophaga costaii]